MKFFVYVVLTLLNVKAGALKVMDNDTDFCKAWTHKDATDTCQCAPDNFYVECGMNHTLVKYQYCVTYSQSTHQGMLGACPYNSHKLKVNNMFSVDFSAVENLNLTTFMCDPLNRMGLLCSHCKPGLGPALLNYSYPCLECTSYGWLAYFTATLIPSTIMMAVIVFFQIEPMSPALNFYIFHCHLMTYYIKHIPNLLISLRHFKLFPLIGFCYKVVATLFGIWNLDFFRFFIPSFCAWKDMSILFVLALEYMVAVYPLLFTALIYGIFEAHARGSRLLNFLWKPFHRLRYRFKKVFNIRGSIVNAFATFICLSYFKILLTSLEIISTVTVYGSASSEFKYRLYFNSSVALTDASTIPYFLVAILMTTLFCVLPLLMLLLCPSKRCGCFHKCRLLSEVIKVFQKHFKDGTDNTRDCRSFSGLYFALRILFLLLNNVRYTYGLYLKCIFSLAVMLLIFYIRPYKNNFYNYLDCFWFAELTVFSLTLLYQIYLAHMEVNLVVIGIGGVLPLLYALSYRMYMLSKILKPRLRCCFLLLPRCCRENRKVEEELPDRIEDSSEYRLLLPKHLKQPVK